MQMHAMINSPTRAAAMALSFALFLGCNSLNGGTSTPPPEFSLTVDKTGDGTGTVTSTPQGDIHCGVVCSTAYDAETTVTLTATPTAGSSFAGWDGACTGL